MDNLTYHHGYTTQPNIILDSISDEKEERKKLESIVKSILGVTCIIAVIVNLKVFACIHWIRRPLNSILKISLSLALSDSCASCLSAAIIFADDVNLRIFIILEIVRMCFILVTVFHLLGLAFSHYIGIRNPLHHNSRLAQKGISGLLVLLWLIPSIFTLALYTVEGGVSFWKSMIENNLNDTNITIVNLNSTIYINESSLRINDSYTIRKEINRTTFIQNETYIFDSGEYRIRFIKTFRFRMAIGSFILISMILIVLCYLWILIMIKRQRKIWKELSRSGSTVWKGHNCRHVSKEKTHEQNKIKGNFRAVYTTLIILGTCFMGWMPALLLYTLICSEDCFISGELLSELDEKYPRHILMVRLFDNEMLLLKMIANPLIYSIRMKEIKDGTKQMHNVLLHHLCGRQCSSRLDRHSKSFLKSNNSTQSHVALTSLKSTKNDKGDSGRSRKNRQACQTSYL